MPEIETGAAGAAGKDSIRASDPIRQACRDCRHFRRPGLSDGYCSGDRPDLPHAYGPGHPLRRLPDDGGEGCPSWAARWAAGPS